MGRPEQPIDPAAGPIAAFASELRGLRRAAGSPAYRELARRAHYSYTTLAAAAAGRALPTLEVTLAFVEACGGDREQWRERWHRAARAETPPAETPIPEPPKSPGIRRLGTAAAAAVLLVAVAVLVSASRGAPSGASRPSRPSEPSTTTTGPYQVVIANDCPPPPPHATVWVETDPGDGWAIGTVGGYRGGGCYGEYLFQRDDAGVPAGLRGGVHWRLTGGPAAAMTCQLSVHIADSPHSAGPAGYVVSSAGPAPPTRTDVDQSRHRGEWIGLGSYPMTGGTLRVDLTGSPKEVTAGPVNVYCLRA